MRSDTRHISAIDANELELQPISAGRSTAQIGKDEEGAGNTVLILGLVWRGDQGAHEPSCRGHVGDGGGLLGFVIAAVGVDQRAVEGQHAVKVLLGQTVAVGDFHLKDGRGIDDAAIALAKAARTSSGGLLSYGEVVVQRRRLGLLLRRRRRRLAARSQR